MLLKLPKKLVITTDFNGRVVVIYVSKQIQSVVYYTP